MDSVTQFALGSSVALAAMGPRSAARSAAWKIALIGGFVGTLPDLDSFIDFGDAISNMVRHRAESHGLLYLTLASPIVAAAVAKVSNDTHRFKQWCLAVWLILITHVGIDFLTIYGTQLAQPFSDQPYGVGSLFVIDPAYTLPLIIGIAFALLFKAKTRWRWNLGGLILSSAYVLWSLAAHHHVTNIARASAPVKNDSYQLLVTASPLNTILWRAVVTTPDMYYEGWYSFFDSEEKFSWQSYPRDKILIERHRNQTDVARIAAFSHGFYNLQQSNGRLFVTDLRLGLEPFYTFRFDLGGLHELGTHKSQRAGERPNFGQGLPWLWHRIQGNRVTLSEYIGRKSAAPENQPSP